MVVDMSNFSLSIMEAEGNMEKGLGWKEISSAEPTEGQLELLIRIMMKTSPAYFGIKTYRMWQAHEEGAGPGRKLPDQMIREFSQLAIMVAKDTVRRLRTAGATWQQDVSGRQLLLDGGWADRVLLSQEGNVPP